MNEQLVKIITSDNAIMHGQIWQPDIKTNKLIIHVHGMAGNFYENDFLFDMAKVYTDNGFAFLSCNNRGHDYIADIAQIEAEGFKGGAAYEIFEDCLKDIDGYMSFANLNGYTDIILQGHSSGANKVVYWCAHNNNFTRLKGLILLSPCDDIGLNIDELGIEKYTELINRAKVLTLSSRGDVLMPEGTFYDYPISARTYLNIFSQGASFDIFHYRNLNIEFAALSKILCPIIVFFGNKNEFLLQESKIVKEAVYDKLKNCSLFEIDGANHSYSGKSSVVLNYILEWIKKQ